MLTYIDGDLIKLALGGSFDVITHGCNCQSNMGAGIAPQMAKAFQCDRFKYEGSKYRGNINKLGNIDYEEPILASGKKLIVVNSYTQYRYGRNHTDGVSKPLDYEALTLCMRKINFLFEGMGMRIGLPKIGAGLAGGDWSVIEGIIQKELRDMIVTIVNYVP